MSSCLFRVHEHKTLMQLVNMFWGYLFKDSVHMEYQLLLTIAYYKNASQKLIHLFCVCKIHSNKTELLFKSCSNSFTFCKVYLQYVNISYRLITRQEFQNDLYPSIIHARIQKVFFRGGLTFFFLVFK